VRMCAWRGDVGVFQDELDVRVRKACPDK
jgi:hypothetical protein